MPRRARGLSAAKVTRARPGRYGDGGGLYLLIRDNGTRFWIFRYTRAAKMRELGLGPVHTVSLKEARERARNLRQQLLDGIDPIEQKRAQRTEQALAAARALTFAEAAQRYFDQNEAKWRSRKHATEFIQSLRAYAFPIIGSMDVAAIDTPHVLRVIDPIWKTRTVTADRVRNRIERILDWSVVRGHRPPGDNPARWKNHLEQAGLPGTKEIAKPQHLAALPYRELPAFMAALRQREGIAARALEFTILTTARSGEVLGAQWDEIDLANALWVIPAMRMKAGNEHRVALSAPALALLRALPRDADSPFVFIGSRPGKGLSKPAMLRVLSDMGHDNITTHGFRSCFSDWSHEQTSHANHTIEISLAHSVGTEVEKSYRRGDMIAKRVKLMAEWATFCARPVPVRESGDKVVDFRKSV
jgi:integrase